MQHAIAVTSPSQETLHAAARPRQSRITALALAVALLATLLPGITAASSRASIEIHQSGNRIVRDHHRTASRAPAGTPAEAPASAAYPAPAAGGTVDAQPATAPDEPTASPEPAATPSPGTNRAEPAVEPAGAAFPFSWKFPTRKPPSFNPATAGGFVTIRFSLGGNRGMGILASPSPTSQRFDCASGALIPHSRYKTRPFGSAGLSYNASAKVYTYTWQTREEWSNSCRRFELALSDGTVHRVKFRIDTFNFIPPILHLPATNPAVAGSVVDVGFHMGASAGAHVIRSNTPRSARVNCGSGALMGPWERTLPHGSAGLTRNPSTHDYHYAWQTDAGWTGTCRRFEMKMRDGSLEVLRFQFNRPPHAVNDSGSGFGTDEASPFTTASVLANDSDPDGDSFSVTGMSAAGTHGSVTNNGDGTFGYSPNGQFEYLASGEHASDTFSYTITDAHGASDTATVTINVDGLNDAPVVANQTRSIAENSANGSNVGVPVAFSDVDTTDGHTFAITAGNGSGAFAINSSTGQITVADASQLDHEATPSYSLTVEVTDDGSPSLSDSATITVNVTDVNEAPVVDAHTFSLAENSANGTSVGTATYSDPDSGQTHIFSITAGNGTGGGAFAIDSSTGAITVNDSAQLDYETTPSFSLTVKVLDNGSPAKFGTNTITVNLTDANDAPVVGAATKSIAENTANGTNVGTPVTYTDQDSPAQGHTFSITGGNGTGGGAFAIDGTTGQLSVNDSAQLDYETVSGHHFLLTVRVTDDGSPGKFGEATVTVNLTNVNDAPVVPDASKSVAEDATNGTNVGSPVAYTDQDAGQTHTFAITAGNTNSAFAINASTGQITVADAGELDHEATPSYSLTIQVTDNGSPGLAGSGTITVNVTDVNEAPVVDAHTFSLAENSANGTAVGTATYTDPDSGQTHTFSITAGNGTGGGAFAINSSTGAITVNDASQLDYETTPSFGLTVKVLDNGSPAKFGTNTITVNLTDANDAPVVGAATKSIAENSANGTNVGTPVTYTDQDSPARGHTFSITGGNGTGGGAFAIDGTTGQLSVNDSAQLDYETTPSFSLTVRVTDDGSPVKFGEATVTVNLTNVNDAPVITLPSSVGAIPMTDSSVNGVSVSDADAGSLDIELVLAVDHGTLTVDETVGGGVVAADVSGNGTATVTLTASQSQIDTTLASSNGLVYHSDTGYLGLTDTLHADADDLGHTGPGGNQTDSDSTAITLNQPPVADPQATSTTEDVAKLITLTASDADDDALTFTAVDPPHGSLNTLNPTADCSAVNTCSAQVTYTPDLDFAGPTDSFTFTVNDGFSTSAPATVTITITPVNDAPVVDASAGTTSFTEDGGAVVIDGSIAVTDIDSALLASGTVQVTGGTCNSAQDLLALASPPIGITVSPYVSGTCTLTLTGPASPADFQTAFRGVTYDNSSQNPDTTTRTVTFTANDGALAGSDTKSVSVTAANDAPVVAVPVGQSTSEDIAKVFSSGNANQISVSDVDAGGSAVQMTIGVTNGTLTLSTTSGLSFSFSDVNGTGSGDGTADAAMTFRGTVAAVNTAMNGLSYQPTLNFNGSSTLSVGANDLGNTGSGGALTDGDSVAITVTAVNDAPVNGVPGTQTFSEDNSRTFSAANSNAITVSDVDAGAGTLTVTFTTTAGTITLGTTAGLTGSSGNGTGTVTATGTIAALDTAFDGLVFAPTLDQNGAQTIGMSTSDNGNTGSGGTQSDNDTINLSITAVNDAPVVTVPVGQSTSEDIAKVFSSGNANQISVSDVDAGGSAVQMTIGVTNGTLTLSTTSGLSFSFSDVNGTGSGDGTADAAMTFRGTVAAVNTAMNGLSYQPALNFNNSRGSESLSILANDLGNTGTGGALTDSDSVGISVTAVNDAPVATTQSFSVQTNLQRTITVALSGGTGPTDPDTGDGGYTAAFTLASVSLPGSGCTGCVISNTNLGAATFDFDPPPGQTGAFTVNYTVTDSGNPGPGATSAAGSLTMNVSGTVIWFVDPSAATNGTGTLAHPFQALAGTAGANNDASEVDAAGHRVFVYSGGTAAGALALNSSEWLIGQAANPGVSFDSFFSLGSLPSGTIARPSLNTGTTTVGGTVTLATSGKVQGVAISTGSSAGLVGSGGITAVDVTQTSVDTTTGVAVNLNNATGTYTLSSVSANGATDGILLTSMGSTSVTVSGGTIAGVTSRGVDISGGTGNFSYSGSITTSATGRSVEVGSHTGGTVAFTGSITDSGIGINLDTNTGSTITFSGGLSVSTLANVGFNAIGGGTVNVCDENPCTTGGAVVNTLNSTSASALNVTGTTIGAEGLTFRSISAGNATAAADPAAGILLNSTGSGGLTVTGIGTTAGSGGTIQNITNRGASFTSAQNITLKNMNFTLVGTVNGADPTVSSGSCGAMDTGGGGNLGCAAGIHLATVTGVTLDRLVMNNDSDPTAGVTSSGQQGINGNNVTTFALTNSQVLNFGNEAGEDGLHFRDIKGTSAITATTVSGSERDQVRVLNGSGTTVTLTVSGGSTFSTSAIPNGGMGIEFEGEGSAAMTIDVQTGTTFSGLRSIGLQALGKANVQMDVKVNASTFLNTGSAGIDIATKDSGDTRFNVTGNGMTNQAATAINIDIGGSPTGTQNATLQGNVSGNTISTTSGSGAIGISLDANGGQVGQGGVLTATVTGNDVTINGGANGIVAIVGDGSPTLNATIKNNTMHSASGGDMFLESSKISTDTSTACMEVSGNNVPNNTSDDVQLSQRFSSTFKMRGFPGGDIGVYFASQNTLNGGTVLFEGTFVNTAGGAACPQPTLP